MSAYEAGTLSATESSRSGSTKSVNIDVSNNTYSKDNKTSPLDLEGNIQTERLTKVLNGLISRTKLALCIPTIVKNQQKLASILSRQHLEDVLYIVTEYETEFIESCLNVASVKDTKTSTVGADHRLNPELGHLMFIMDSYPELHDETETVINKMQQAYLLEPNPGFKYLLILKHYREQMLKQMTLSAADELRRKLQLRKVQNSNNEHLKKIEECTAIQNKEKMSFDGVMSNKKETIAKIEQELHWLQIDASAKLKMRILDSDRQMVLQFRRHKIRHQILEAEEKETLTSFNNFTNGNLASEKKKRLHRFKVEMQLLSWIQKYDTDMSEKRVEYDEYIDLYKEEMEKLEILQKQLTEQDKEYYVLMEEREKEYHEELAEKMNDYTLEHAARVIQTAWKLTLTNRAAKKKLKKVLVKLKKKVEIQEKKNELMQRKKEAEAKKMAKKKKK